MHPKATIVISTLQILLPQMKQLNCKDFLPWFDILVTTGSAFTLTQDKEGPYLFSIDGTTY